MARTTQRKTTSTRKKGSKTAASAEGVDGRTARAARTRDAVIEATIALMDSGNVRPTAPLIAENAGVSLRSVFQHFADLDTLYATAADRFFERARAGVGEPVEASGSFSARLDAFVQRRAAYWESASDVARSCDVLEPFSERIQDVMKEQRKLARSDVSRAFAADLKKASDKRDVLDAVDLATGWPAWNAMRRGQKMSRNRAATVMAKAVNAAFSAGFK